MMYNLVAIDFKNFMFFFFYNLVMKLVALDRTKKHKAGVLQANIDERIAALNEWFDKLDWSLYHSQCFIDMIDDFEKDRIDREIAPTAKSTGKTRIVNWIGVRGFFKDDKFNAFGTRKRKLDLNSMIDNFLQVVNEIEELSGIEIGDLFKAIRGNTNNMIVFNRKTNPTQKDQWFKLGSFDKIDSLSGIAPQYGYYGLYHEEEPVQAKDISGITHEEYDDIRDIAIDSMDRFAKAANKTLWEISTMNGWDDRHSQIKKAEEINPWDEFIDYCSEDFVHNHTMRIVKDRIGVTRKTKFSNPIEVRTQKQIDILLSKLEREGDRARILGQVLESSDDIEEHYKLFMATIEEKGNVFSFEEKVKEGKIKYLDADFGIDWGTWDPTIIILSFKYYDAKTKRIKSHLYDYFEIDNKKIVKKDRMTRIDHREIQEDAALWLKSHKSDITDETVIYFDYADKIPVGNIEDKLDEKYNIEIGEFEPIMDKNKKGVFDWEARTSIDVEGASGGYISLEPHVAERMAKELPYIKYKANGQVDHLNATNKIDFVECMQRAYRDQATEWGEKYE